MPDVTPKAESGRALTPEQMAARIVGGFIIGPADVRDHAIKVVRQELVAWQREAASAAVAEVLDRLEVGVDALPKDRGDESWSTVSRNAIRALIASERGT